MTRRRKSPKKDRHPVRKHVARHKGDPDQPKWRANRISDRDLERIQEEIARDGGTLQPRHIQQAIDAFEDERPRKRS